MPCGALGFPAYASSAGIQNLRRSPTVISCSPSIQPLITLVSGKLAGPDSSELSISVPSACHPTYSTVTRSCFLGRSLPLPGLRTLLASPDAVLTASGGGAATSGGGVSSQPIADAALWVASASPAWLACDSALRVGVVASPCFGAA